MYAVNLGILAVVGLAVVVGLNWGLYTWTKNQPSVRRAIRFDWTSNKIYSLSDSTLKLLDQIDAKGQPYELAVITSGNPKYAETGTRIQDMLQEYASHSKQVKVKEYSPANVEDLEARIRENYKDEIKPYEAVLKDTDKILVDLKAFFATEAAGLGQLAQADGVPADERQQWSAIQQNLASVMPEVIDEFRTKLSNALESTLPEYSDAVNSDGGAKTAMSVMDDALTRFVKFAASPEMKQYSPAAQKYFTEAAARFKDKQTAVGTLMGAIGDLKPLKLDEVRSTLTQWSVVIFGPASVQVVPISEMQKDAPQQDPNSKTPPPVRFEGEQAVSSRLLAMFKPDKLKVVFVSATPMNLIQGQFSDFADRLTKANFNVLEWSPGGGDAPSNAAPPAIGNGVVWVIFSPPPAGMGPPPTELVTAVERHISAGGNAMFLAEAGGQGPMLGMEGAAGYPFNSILSRFGLQAQTDLTVVHTRTGQQGKPVSIPVIETDKFEIHPITQNLSGLLSVFYGDPQSGRQAPVPVNILEKKSDGVDVKPLLKLTGADTFAAARYDPTAERTADDKPAPFALGAAATMKHDNQEQRVVLFGDEMFASNQPMEMGEEFVSPDGTQEKFVNTYPGNAELATNATMWLAGYDNMISVSSRATAAARIRDMSDGMQWGMNLGVAVFGVPLLVLLLGGGVYFVRRR